MCVCSSFAAAHAAPTPAHAALTPVHDAHDAASTAAHAAPTAAHAATAHASGTMLTRVKSGGTCGGDTRDGPPERVCST